MPWRNEVFDGFINYVGLDLETTDYRGHGSLDFRRGGIALIQVNINDEEIKLLRPTKENLKFVKNLVEDDKTLVIGHNLGFDLKFLANVGIFPKHVFDTQIASELIYAGFKHVDKATAEVLKVKQTVKDTADSELFDYDELREYLGFKQTKQTRFSHNLATVLFRELGVLVPKEMQNSDWMREPLSAAQKEYAENDVKYLIKLAQKLTEKIIVRNLERVFLLEMAALHAVAFMEFVGVKVDAEEWKRKTNELKKKLKEEKERLEKKFGLKLAEKEGNYGLFGLEPVPVNLNSPVQMSKILGLPNVQAETLARYGGDDPDILEYIEYKKLEKLVSTYGEAYLNRIGSDGRLRGNFTQTAVATGRLSSRSPNLQNIPPDFIKSMIRAEPGYIEIAADYSQVELRILAFLSGDENFIEATKSSDLHAATARLIYHISDDEPVPSELRRKAKVVNFGIPYGISPAGLMMRGYFDSFEEAEEVLKMWKERFPTAWEFLQNSARHAIKYGFTTDAIGRRRNYKLPDKPDDYENGIEYLKLLTQRLKEKELSVSTIFKNYETFKDFEESEDHREEFELFISTFPNNPKGVFDSIARVKKYDAQIAAIQRQAQNMPIQSTSASITKQALGDLYEDMLINGRYIFTLSIHDSIFFEVQKEYAIELAERVKAIMEAAGPKVVPGIITPVDVDFGHKQEYRCIECGKPVLKFNLVVEDNKVVERDPSTVLCEDCEKARKS